MSAAPGARSREPGASLRRAFHIIEVAVSLVIVVVLLAVLLPAMSRARAVSHQQECADHLRSLAVVWETYLADHDEQFPFIAVQPGWFYGGVRFSAVTGEPFLDFQRPLDPSLLAVPGGAVPDRERLFRCPADTGITGAAGEVGTGDRTAYRAFGTSYRANAMLMDASAAGVSPEPRGLFRSEITAAPSRLLVMGDPIWYEVSQNTGRDATWHRRPDYGNLVFLDGSVRFQEIRPLTANQPVVFDPLYGWGRAELEEEEE